MTRLNRNGLAAFFAAALLSTSALAQSECTGDNCPKPGATGQTTEGGAAAGTQGGTAGQTTEGGAAAGTQGGTAGQTTEGGAAAGTQGGTAGQTTEGGAAAGTQGGTAGQTTEGGAAAGTQGGTAGQTTEGGAAAGTQVEITQEQRTELTTVITQVEAPRVTVDFNVDIGIAVPATVELRPLPARVIEIVPAYRGYLFFITADGRIIIVAPDTRQIVYVIA